MFDGEIEPGVKLSPFQIKIIQTNLQRWKFLIQKMFDVTDEVLVFSNEVLREAGIAGNLE